ncbi:MAG: peptidylprolyl isomerase [Candidatus Rokuibacteriota bacterium]
MLRRVAPIVVIALLGSGIAAAQPKEAPKAATPPARGAPAAVITMEKGGQVRLELWPGDAPNHVKNFLDLARKGFYDGQRVHRVEPGFVVQFGDPQTKKLAVDDPRVGGGGPGYTIKAEFNKRPFDRGVLGMARTDDPHSAGSQVYLMLGPAHFLNGQYTAFGRVTSGMDVVDRIKVGDRITSVKVVDK